MSTPKEQVEEFLTKRRMPEALKVFLLKVQGGKLYLPVAYRLVWFRDECPDWGITTVLIEGGQEAGFCTMAASIINPEGRTISTGHKTETRQHFPDGFVEKAETGAVGRALDMCGFGTQFSQDLDENGRYADAPLPATAVDQKRTRPAAGGAARVANVLRGGPEGDTWEGPGQCPRCHAPEGKRHGKPCVS